MVLSLPIRLPDSAFALVGILDMALTAGLGPLASNSDL